MGLGGAYTGIKKKRTKRRLGILREVSNATWGLETRILAITTHSLIESVKKYGLGTFGALITETDERALDTELLNEAARRVIGTGITVRREVQADTRTTS